MAKNSPKPRWLSRRKIAVAIMFISICCCFSAYVFSKKPMLGQKSAQVANGVSKNPDGPKGARITWTKYSLPAPNGKDIVGEALAEFEKVLDLLSKEAKEDALLMGKINDYRQSSLSREEIDADLQNLEGLQLDCIGQLHQALGVNQECVARIQAGIANMILKNYEVVWAEDFTGGGIITKDNAWKEVQDQFAQCSIPEVKEDADEESARRYLLGSIPMYASSQLLFNHPDFGGELRGADYRPIKAIQQRLLEYLTLAQMRRPLPSNLDINKRYPEIVKAISEARDIYILSQVSRHADRSKKNVLVFGIVHLDDMAQIMANYRTKSTIIAPK